MSNIAKYAGINFDIFPLKPTHPEAATLKGVVETALASRLPSGDPAEAYLCTFHVDGHEDYRGMTGLNSRFSQMTISVSVNPHQRRENRILLLNDLVPPHVASQLISHSYTSYTNRYTVDSKYFAAESHFRDSIVAVIAGHVPIRDRKVTVKVSLAPTSSLKNVFANLQGNIVTKMEFFFDRQYNLFTR